jgi:hypothetical protein
VLEDSHLARLTDAVVLFANLGSRQWAENPCAQVGLGPDTRKVGPFTTVGRTVVSSLCPELTTVT